MKKLNTPTVPSHDSARHHNVSIIRSVLISLVVLALAGALLAGRKWSQSRDRSAKPAVAQAMSNQSRPRQTQRVSPAASQSWLEDHFSYRNLVSLPDQRAERTSVNSPRRPVDQAESGLVAAADQEQSIALRQIT